MSLSEQLLRNPGRQSTSLRVQRGRASQGHDVIPPRCHPLKYTAPIWAIPSSGTWVKLCTEIQPPRHGVISDTQGHPTVNSQNMCVLGGWGGNVFWMHADTPDVSACIHLELPTEHTESQKTFTLYRAHLLIYITHPVMH